MSVRLRYVVLAMGVAAALLAPSSAAQPRLASPLADEKQQDCTTGTAVAGGLVADDGAQRALRVLVLVDGPKRQRAAEVMAAAARSYAPIGISLQPTLRMVRMTGDGNDAGALLDEAQAMYGGTVPAGFDAVHVFTSKPIAGWGLARCIEGVGTQNDAYSVSEDAEGQAPKITGETQMPWLWGDLTALVVAHELGHLMGGRHELANCAEGVTQPDLPRPCTLMDTSLTMSPDFSTANAAVVRQLALRFLPRA